MIGVEGHENAMLDAGESAELASNAHHMLTAAKVEESVELQKPLEKLETMESAGRRNELKDFADLPGDHHL